jgi:hypothetical protein
MTVKKLSAKLCDILDVTAKSGSVVQIDTLFGKLAFDVICEVAFQTHVGALDESADFKVRI